MNVLMLIPHRMREDSGDRLVNTPRDDINTLRRAITAIPGARATVLDHLTIERDPAPLVLALKALFGPNIALAMRGFLEATRVDAIFTHGEGVGIPLALLLAFRRKRARHVAVAHFIIGHRMKLFFRVLCVDHRMDQILTYSDSMTAELKKYGVAPSRVRRISLGVDTNFFTPVQSHEEVGLVCAVGREFRDYQTLIAAVSGMTGVTATIDPGSPWSTQDENLDETALPPNVTVTRLAHGEARSLYMRASIVAIPLQGNQTGAGLTSMLEALAMGKAVIMTRSGNSFIIDGETGLLAEPGDVTGWRTAIQRLIENPALRARIGENGRRWVLTHASMQNWAAVVIQALSKPRHECRREAAP